MSWSPTSIPPSSSIAPSRSASPSKPMPMSAPCSRTASISCCWLRAMVGSGWWAGKRPSISGLRIVCSPGRDLTSRVRISPAAPLALSHTTLSARSPPSQSVIRRAMYSDETSTARSLPSASSTTSPAAAQRPLARMLYPKKARLPSIILKPL